MKANVVFFSGIVNPDTGEPLLDRIEKVLDLFSSDVRKEVRFNPDARHDAPNVDPTLACFHEAKGGQDEKDY